MYDICIIGAGPSGATLARLLGKKYKILLLEKRNLLKDSTKDPYRKKSCGGLLAPDAQMLLGKLSLGIPKNILASPQLFVVRTIDIKNSIERFYQRHYINIDRELFDRWLVSLIPSSVNIRFEAIFSNFNKADDFYKIDFFIGEKKYSEKSKIIIGADGAFSRVRRIAFPFHKFPKFYITVQKYYKTKKILPYYSVIFDNEITDFYSWLIPKDEYLIAGTAVSPGDNIHGKFDLLHNKLENYGIHLENNEKSESAYLARPVKVNQIFTGNNNIALVGEAAGFISPSSAEGISYSFITAIQLSRSLLVSDNSFQRKYQSYISSIKRNIFLKNCKSKVMYSSLLRKIILKTGIKSIDILDLEIPGELDN